MNVEELVHILQNAIDVGDLASAPIMVDCIDALLDVVGVHEIEIIEEDNTETSALLLETETL